MSDNGYDVWLANTRGNDYGLHHNTLNVTSKEFWNFSFHEIGSYDLSAMIDYVLNKTKSTQLFYVGHSQGATSLLVLLSMRPDYNQKIFQAHLFTPAAFFSHNENVLIRLVVGDFEVFRVFSKQNGTFNFLFFFLRTT